MLLLLARLGVDVVAQSTPFWTVFAERATTLSVLSTYFDHPELEDAQTCCVFCANNMPVACFTYRHHDENACPKVERFFFDKEMILTLNLGDTMRTCLLKRHPQIDVKTAINYIEYISL